MMKKRLATLMIVGSLPLSAADDTIRYGYAATHAFLPAQQSLQLLGEYRKINETLDIFNIRESEFGGGLANLGAIGDLDGYRGEVRYRGEGDRLYRLTLRHDTIQYNLGDLKNTAFDLSIRQNVTTHPYRGTAWSIDAGLRGNRADDIRSDNLASLVSVIKANDGVADARIVEQNGQYTLGVILEDGSTLTKTLNERPSLVVRDMFDATGYLRLLGEKRFSPRLLLTGYLEGGHTYISSLATTNDDLRTIVENEGYSASDDLDRHEWYLEAGFNLSWDMGPVVGEFRYAYRRMFRDAGLDYVDYNHVVDAVLEKGFDANRWVLYVGGKFMYRQLNGEIPYLYNQYTQTSFDHRYGFARFGVIYHF